MEENAAGKVQKQIIVHQSNWGSQLIKVLIFVFIGFVFIKKNPTSHDLQKYLIKSYCEEKGIETPICKFIGESAPDLLSSFVERKDFIFFSYYTFHFKNDETKLDFEFIGALNSFIPVNEIANNSNESNQQTDSIPKKRLN